MLKKIVFIPVWLFIVSLITSCAPPSHVAVYERTTISSQAEIERLGGQRIHIIKAGDTLYSISFANGLNVNTLAAWNSVRDTSKLAIGQRIRLTKPTGFLANNDLNKTGTTRVNINRNIDIRSDKQKAAVSKQKLPKWSWPTKGKVTQLFAPGQGQQGIDLQGRLGQNIMTTDAGEVVYVGNGLKGYGNLIIIKHSQHFLSAYAHNQKIFVKEGQAVKAQSKIATMGRDKNKIIALHFQIRKNGKPVDPLKYLSKR